MKMNRRTLLKQAAASAAVLVGASKLAQAQQARVCEDTITPQQTKGPFYPVVSQLDTDADLVQIKGGQRAANGKVILIQGKVMDPYCLPVEGALVEIWQACESGRYNHPSDTNPAPLDPHFQYWGKAVTDTQGNYQFRTIIPGAYPADKDWMRPPHIHFKVSKKGIHELVTQLYFAGEALNATDLILQDLSEHDQEAVIAEIKEVEGLPHPLAKFDIVVRKIVKKPINFIG